MYLDLNVLPVYYSCDFRRFEANEKHIDRLINFDVMVMVFEGKLTFYELGEKVTVGAGKWYIQRAGLKHEGREPCDSPYYFYIHFKGRYTHEKTDFPICGGFDPNIIMPAIQKLSRLEKQFHEKKIKLHGAFYEILSLLVTDTYIDKTSDTILAEVLEHITENFSSNISSKELSSISQYSYDYLIKIFKQKYLMTPHQYIIKMRLGQVEQLLISTNRTLDIIAMESGFNDLALLQRSFKHKHNMTPGKWRAMQRGSLKGENNDNTNS